MSVVAHHAGQEWQLWCILQACNYALYVFELVLETFCFLAKSDWVVISVWVLVDLNAFAPVKGRISKLWFPQEHDLYLEKIRRTQVQH